MVEALPVIGSGASVATGDICADTLLRLAELKLHLRICTQPGESAADTREGWIGAEDLLSPERSPFAPLLAHFANVGATPNRRAAAASFLLRFGWASGFAIASYLACERVPLVRDYALLFSPSKLLRAFWIRDVDFCSTPERTRLRERLLESLLSFSSPVVRAQHGWSRFSAHALWSMVISSWGAQFTTIGRQLGDAAWGIAEARAIFALDPNVARAAPELYEVRVDDAACTCQRRAACCLHFKRPGRQFCASCPVIPAAERLDRNRRWISAQRPLVCA